MPLNEKEPDAASEKIKSGSVAGSVAARSQRSQTSYAAKRPPLVPGADASSRVFQKNADVFYGGDGKLGDTKSS